MKYCLQHVDPQPEHASFADARSRVLGVLRPLVIEALRAEEKPLSPRPLLVMLRKRHPQHRIFLTMDNLDMVRKTMQETGELRWVGRTARGAWRYALAMAAVLLVPFTVNAQLHGRDAGTYYWEPDQLRGHQGGMYYDRRGNRWDVDRDRLRGAPGEGVTIYRRTPRRHRDPARGNVGRF